MSRGSSKSTAGLNANTVLVEGQQLRYCGIGIGYDDVYIQGNPAELKFIAYYIKGGQVTAVAR